MDARQGTDWSRAGDAGVYVLAERSGGLDYIIPEQNYSLAVVALQDADAFSEGGHNYVVYGPDGKQVLGLLDARERDARVS